MSGSKRSGRCRAVQCKGRIDCRVLLKVGADTGNPTYVHIGLCRKHTRAWLDHLDGNGPAVSYKAYRPPHLPLDIEVQSRTSTATEETP